MHLVNKEGGKINVANNVIAVNNNHILHLLLGGY